MKRNNDWTYGEMEAMQEDKRKRSLVQSGVMCPLCPTMTQGEVWEKYRGDIVAMYLHACQEHSPMIIERLEKALKQIKEMGK